MMLSGDDIVLKNPTIAKKSRDDAGDDDNYVQLDLAGGGRVIESRGAALLRGGPP